jgi:OmcA/MtrC family decaheme c-type cytochrome
VNASLQDPRDDYNISPIAAVCSSCHDSALEQAHMKINGAVFSDTGVNSTQLNLLGAIETCAVCHGPGAVADLDVVHSIPP